MIYFENDRVTPNSQLSLSIKLRMEVVNINMVTVKVRGIMENRLSLKLKNTLAGLDTQSKIISVEEDSVKKRPAQDYLA